ncbi:hypothetical protein GPA27_20175 [Aromatoleum toluolicum]|uniref:Doubled CXXCH motif domain-containing protein n=1 Tax=Aromatoleum toluolicum TaxID=90060 RepID=A0ABX1NK46_9RHOO|nr:hypothetical protein [Aromatoleum toluolicum]NMF99699.1 hypothetical protein [Aromatoleum toluolicum]
MVTTRGISLLLAATTAIYGAGTARADYSDCRTCHYATNVDSGTPDLTGYFVDPGHHPVRVNYPIRPDYHLPPTTTTTGILFFDVNGNGAPDPNEVQLFSSSVLSATTGTGTTTRSKGKPKSTVTTDTWVIDCASCHIEHGLTPADPQHTADYVRGAGGDRLLCITCHNM